MNREDFEKLYNNAINSVGVNPDIQHLDMFGPSEDFDDLDEFDELLDFDSISDIKFPTKNSRELAGNFPLLTVQLHNGFTAKAVSATTLDSIILEDLQQEDYVVKYTDFPLIDSWEANFNERCSSENEAACKFLELLYHVGIPDAQILKNCDRKLLELIQMEARDLTVSEIELLKDSYTEDWFDERAFKLFALAERDTSLLLQLMKSGNLDVKALAKFAYNEEILNAYLILTLQGRYNEETFLNVANNPENLSSYVSTCLSNDSSEFLFLCEHKDFGKIIELLKQLQIAEKPAPFDLLNKYADNPYLYYILTAYAGGYLNEDFVKNNLCEQSALADAIAEDYISNCLDHKLIEKLGGHYYIPKLVSDISKQCMYTDKIYAACEFDENLIILNQYSQLLIKAFMLGKIEEIEYRKILTLVTYENWLSLIKSYVDLSADAPIEYSLFCFNYLLSHVLDITVNTSFTGSILEIYDGKSCKFLSIESALHNVDALCSAIYACIPKDILNAKILPCSAGIFLGNIDKPINANPALRVFMGTSSSIENFVLEYKSLEQDKIPDNVIQRYNLVKALNTVDSVTDAVEQLVKSPVQKYMKYDRFFDAITRQFTDYRYLLQSNQFFSLYNIFVLSLNYDGKAQQFLAFVLTLCRACCPDWCKVYNYHPEILRDDARYCVTGSSRFGSASSKDILENIHSFIVEIARLRRVQVQIMNSGEVEIRGVN